MGCDIHAYIEYEGGRDRPFEALFLGEAELPRNYRVFKALAGLRSDFMTCTIVGWVPVSARPEAVQIIFDSWRFLQQGSVKGDIHLFGNSTGRTL